MHFIDWSIFFVSFIAIFSIAYATKKYTKSVADFLVANRCAGKYLLGVSDGIAALGAITIVAMFEMFYKAGFTAQWWLLMKLPIAVIIAMTGWIQYRYRETRVLTLAQFFENRYSRNFRIFSGIMGFTAGLINFGIFPAVGGRFFQYFMDLPTYFISIGPMNIDLVYAAIMIILLVISLAFTFMGGQIAVMVTDFVQGTFCNIAFLIIATYILFFHFDWSQIMEAAAMAPANASMINPLKTSGTDNFNFTYFLIAIVTMFIVYMSWQGNQGYSGSAKSPHEAKMGRVFGSFRMIIQNLPLLLLAIGAYTLLHHASFTEQAGAVNEVLGTIENTKIQEQLRVTVAIRHILPIGLMGIFATVMFAAFVSTHDTYLHSWGCIFIQDIILPIRKIATGNDKPLEPKQHIRWLRYSILGVAIFIFLFSLLLNQKQDIFMFFALTANIFVGWAGVTIVGGLYWKHGNTIGAWASSTIGVILALIGWRMTYYWVDFYARFGKLLPETWTETKCPFNGQILFFWTIVASLLTYIVASLLTSKGKGFNMDRLLHRGKYSIDGEHSEASKATIGWKIFGMGKEFTKADKIIFISSYAYIFSFFGLFIVGTIFAIKTDFTDKIWSNLWYIYCIIVLVMSAILTIWLTIGGCINLKELFAALKTAKRDNLDNGSVIEDNEK